MQRRLLPFFSFLFLISCQKSNDEGGELQTAKTPNPIEVPPFSADSAYAFIEKQVNMGPRVPGSAPHREAAGFFVSRFESYGATVTVQEFEQTTYDGTRLQLKNIIASFYPEKQKRVLLAAHWDTRPFADQDKVNPNGPMDGANDGASGVAVLLEIARSLHNSPDPPPVGVDIILFDGEDWGERVNERLRPPPPGLQSWWCLGSQYWSMHKHKPNYSAYYGILLDMVGAEGSQFYREGLSLRYAPSVVEKVWSAAAQLGHSRFFVKRDQPEIGDDDHKYVTENARIPMIDIVNYDPVMGTFGSFHHTQADNMDIISREPLRAVGETVIYLLYHEEPGV
jgi:hypothetical protein